MLISVGFRPSIRHSILSCSGVRPTYPAIALKPLLNTPLFPSASSFFSTYYGLLNKNDKKIESKISTKTVIEKSIEKSKELRSNIKTLIKDTTVRENIYTIPNFLTMTRLIAAPIVGYLIVQQQVLWALGLFTYSCITDFVDGYIARRFNLKTVIGTIIDPMADKSLMIICTLCLTQAGQLPLYLAVLILGRDILLGLSAIYYRYISLPPPKTFMRFFDFSIASAEVHPTNISKVNTGLQMLYIGSCVVKAVLVSYLGDHYTSIFLEAMSWFELVVASTTILSGLSYVFSKDAVKILTKRP